jgi:hypothetical protein
MIGIIYQLVCPIRKEPIYVGSTTCGLKMRMYGHVADAKKSDRPLYKYIRSTGRMPKIESLDVVEVADYAELEKTERAWIQKIMETYPLFNIHIYSNEETISRGLRLDESLWNTIEQLAKEANVSWKEYIENVLTDHVS